MPRSHLLYRSVRSIPSRYTCVYILLGTELRFEWRLFFNEKTFYIQQSFRVERTFVKKFHNNWFFRLALNA